MPEFDVTTAMAARRVTDSRLASINLREVAARFSPSSLFGEITQPNYSRLYETNSHPDWRDKSTVTSLGERKVIFGVYRCYL